MTRFQLALPFDARERRQKKKQNAMKKKVTGDEWAYQDVFFHSPFLVCMKCFLSEAYRGARFSTGMKERRESIFRA